MFTSSSCHMEWLLYFCNDSHPDQEHENIRIVVEYATHLARNTPHICISPHVHILMHFTYRSRHVCTVSFTMFNGYCVVVLFLQHSAPFFLYLHPIYFYTQIYIDIDSSDTHTQIHIYACGEYRPSSLDHVLGKAVPIFASKCDSKQMQKAVTGWSSNKSMMWNYSRGLYSQPPLMVQQVWTQVERHLLL